MYFQYVDHPHSVLRQLLARENELRKLLPNQSKPSWLPFTRRRPEPSSSSSSERGVGLRRHQSQKFHASGPMIIKAANKPYQFTIHKEDTFRVGHFGWFGLKEPFAVEKGDRVY